MIELNGVRKLVSPAIIAAFEGWNDAGEAASGVVDHLGMAWEATQKVVLPFPPVMILVVLPANVPWTLNVSSA